MVEYLINCGEFNILVIPDRREYYMLGPSGPGKVLEEADGRLLGDFLEGRDLRTEGLRAHWFEYRSDEVWHGMDGREHGLGKDMDEATLIDYFVLKKHNFGSLVAVRDSATRKLKVFKRARLPEIADVGA